MMTKTRNLDKYAADAAQKMVQDAPNANVKKTYNTLENLVTKSLGVLQSQGIYAAMLFLFSRSSDEGKMAPFVRENLYALLRKLPAFEQDGELATFDKKTDAQKVLAWFSKQVLDDLDTLLLVRDLYVQTLIYARYGAKAREG